MLGLTSQKQGCENRHAPGRHMVHRYRTDTSRCFHCTFSLSSDCGGCNASFLVGRITVKVALSIWILRLWMCLQEKCVIQAPPLKKILDYENNRGLVVLFIVISWVRCCFPGQSAHRAPLWLPYLPATSQGGVGPWGPPDAWEKPCNSSSGSYLAGGTPGEDVRWHKSCQKSV